MLGGGGAYDHTLARLQQGRADTCHLGGTLAAGVDDLRDALPGRAAEVEGGELVEVADLAPLQASGGRLYREVAARDRCQGLLEFVHTSASVCSKLASG
jgi:hypothetical protein